MRKKPTLGPIIGQSRTPRPIAVSKERRSLIETQIEQLAATARKVASELPFSADVSDYVRVLEEAGSA